MKQQPNLIFLHIGKTGGSTLATILNRIFSPNSFFYKYVIPISQNPSLLGIWSIQKVKSELLNVSIEEKLSWEYIGGHLPFGIHEYLGARSYYVTLLRDPVERVLSSYYYCCQRHYDVTGEKIDLESFINSEQGMFFSLAPQFESLNILVVDNYQVPHLSGIGELNPTKRPNLTNIKYVKQKQCEQAKTNIKNYFLLVGFTEQFDEFLILLRKLSGCRFSDLLYQRKNVTKNRLKKAQIPQHILETIQEKNQHDIELYNYCRKKFNDLVSEYGVLFYIQLYLFKILNSIQNRKIKLINVYKLADIMYYLFTKIDKKQIFDNELY